MNYCAAPPGNFPNDFSVQSAMGTIVKIIQGGVQLKGLMRGACVVWGGSSPRRVVWGRRGVKSGVFLTMSTGLIEYRPLHTGAKWLLSASPRRGKQFKHASTFQ